MKIYVINCNESFAPVANVVTLRILLVIDSYKKWHVYQMDINNAFLHSDLDEKLYLILP